ncbi:hypothetical protein [Ornithinibacillus hominis]|uniref:hypothetical protein n=1 Tax=Ornithinibacillus hominis TaxID=2763055 RepID=UPI001C9A34DA|nr:hypothetical protein [Ornithinibacillus hominis]
MALLALMYYYSVIFTTICLPIMWWYYDTPLIDYYVFNIGILFLGGIVFNMVFTKIYPFMEEEMKDSCPIKFILFVFGRILIFYSILCFTIFIITDNSVPFVYLLIFLMAGGYFWFCIIRGYILAKEDYTDTEIKSGIPWKGKVLVFSIPVSMLLGYLFLY